LRCSCLIAIWQWARKTVIFINHDTLDCRRANLKVVTTEEARRQHRVRSDNPTGYKGISFNPGPRTWSVDIWRGRERKRVGTFLTQREAMDAYEAAVRWVKTDLFPRKVCDAGMIER